MRGDPEGFENLKRGDRERLTAAWGIGYVAEEDIPSPSNKSGDEGEETRRKKSEVDPLSHHFTNANTPLWYLYMFEHQHELILQGRSNRGLTPPPHNATS